MRYQYLDSEYRIKIDMGLYNVAEICLMPGTNKIGLARVNEYDREDIFYSFVNDLCDLSGRTEQGVLEFLGIDVVDYDTKETLRKQVQRLEKENMALKKPQNWRPGNYKMPQVDQSFFI